MAESYEKAGVNLEAGYEVVRRIKSHVASTARTGVMGGIGSFGGMFDLSALGYKEPVLVSGADGVGTKLKIAFAMDKHNTIGIDAVAMCVNDVLAQGAEPLFFLDYIAAGHNDPVRMEQIVAGVADGCRQAGCALVGGETAEMPGMYAAGEYDIAGFTVGAVEKGKLLDGSKVKVGDVLVGIASSGIHSNGFSLVRRIIEENGLDFKGRYFDSDGNVIGAEGADSGMRFEGATADVTSRDSIVYDEENELLASKTFGELVLMPTKIYVKSVLPVLAHCDVHAAAHITGGGFDENLSRMVQAGQGVRIVEGSWKILPIFTLLEKYGRIQHREMYNIFNMGIGMVLVLAPEEAQKAVAILESEGEKASLIGTVTDEEGVKIVSR
ncbi:MAG: phosphoribosylformylglycinamidine cyclo-ligase [Bacteroidales bacterium]|nr:phosphoribosylformylglycinamidine cyclo-ligase [Bacteroidales bacterium]